MSGYSFALRLDYSLITLYFAAGFALDERTALRGPLRVLALVRVR